MFRKPILIIAVLSLLLLASPAFSAPDIKEGSWEVTLTTEMPGMPVSLPPTTYTTCLTQDDIVPNDPQQSKDCQIMDVQENGGTVTWKLKCTQEGSTIESTGKMVYAGDTFTGEVNSTMDIPGQGKMEMKAKMSGKYVGPCSE